MSNINNDVSRVLITTGNQAPLGVDLTLDDLALGQIGIFDFDTGLSIDATKNPRRYFIAVGVDTDGMGVKDDVKKSSGEYIQRKNVYSYNFREHTANRSMQQDVSDFEGKCDTEYIIRVEFRNDQILRTQGNNQFIKVYTIKTGCCDECENCPTADANEVTRLFLAEINRDEDELLTAIAITPNALTTATHGTSQDYNAGDEILGQDILALEAYNALETTDEADRRYTNIRIEPSDINVTKYCNVNLKYFYPRKTIILATLGGDGFDCKGTVTTFQEAVFEEGNGYDIKQKEYHAGHHSGGSPYKVSAINSVADNFRFYAVETEKYDQIAIEYVKKGNSAWNEYDSHLSTIIAVPVADALTIMPLIVILDALITPLGHDPLLDDAANRDLNPANIATTSGIDDVEADGLS